jgi:hypothetical protein
MAGNLVQVQWVSTGWTGAPGYTSFYLASLDDTAINDFLDATHDFLAALTTYIPSSITYVAPANYRVVDAATGVLADIVPFGTPSTNVTGSSGNGFAAPAGFSVNWLTTTAATHRLVVGRTYIVPVDDVLYQTDGTLKTADLAAIQTAASALVSRTDPNFCVWRRPVLGAGGSVAPIVAAKVNDRVSVLRSRRA